MNDCDAEVEEEVDVTPVVLTGKRKLCDYSGVSGPSAQDRTDQISLGLGDDIDPLTLLGAQSSSTPQNDDVRSAVDVSSTSPQDEYDHMTLEFGDDIGPQTEDVPSTGLSPEDIERKGRTRRNAWSSVRRTELGLID